MRDDRGFTLIELLTVVFVTGVALSLFVALLSQLRDAARSAACLSNLRQWGSALGMFVQDHEGRIPRRGQGVRPLAMIDRPEDWFNCLPPYMGLPSYSELEHRGSAPRPGEKSIFVCPSAGPCTEPHFLSYAMNMYLSPWSRPDMHRMQEIPSPSTLAFLADGPGGWASAVPSSQAYSVQARHRGHANVLFVDGHVASFEGTYLGCGVGNDSHSDIRWQTDTGGVNQSPVP